MGLFDLDVVLKLYSLDADKHTKEVLLIIFVMVFSEVEGKGTEILCR